MDLHKTDALLQISGLQYGHDEAANIYYAMVLEQHGITQAQFDSSLVWYTAHPQLFDKIYPKVLAKLHAEGDAFEQTYAEELRMRPDFLREYDHPRVRNKKRPRLTQTQLDSMLWVTQHGYPTLWQPLPDSLMHNTEDKLLP